MGTATKTEEHTLHVYLSSPVGKSKFQATKLDPHENIPQGISTTTPLWETAGKLSSRRRLIGRDGGPLLMSTTESIFKQYRQATSGIAP